jgi:hypothetical protein
MRCRPESRWLGSDGVFYFIDLKCGVSIWTCAFDILTGKLENWKKAEAGVVIGIAKYPVFGGSIDQRKLCARRPIRQIGNGAGKFLSGLLS